MKRILYITVLLMGLWILLSGMFTPLLLGLGLGSSFIVACLLVHLDITASFEQYPKLAFGCIRYLPWLMIEVVKSSWEVTCYAWGPLHKISPNIAVIKALQKTPVGLVSFANSITLTPGTLSIDIQDDEIEVHSMTLDMQEILQLGEMNRRVARLEGTEVK